MKSLQGFRLAGFFHLYAAMQLNKFSRHQTLFKQIKFW